MYDRGMSITPKERVESDLRTALKAGDKRRLATLRLLLAEIENEQIREGSEIDETRLFALVRKGIKQRRESAEQYRSGDREESAVAEEAEAAILEEYLPQQASEEELRSAVRAIIEEKGLEGPRGIGPVMSAMMERYAGRADGSMVSRIARELLS